jgi:hypothetical protein
LLEDLETGRDIAEATDRLLLRADARYRFPTPVDDLVAAAGLVEPASSLLSDARLSEAPAHLRGILRQVVGKVQGLVDRKTKEVHLRPGIEHDHHRRFVKLHEVTHEILPWQAELAYADTVATLSPATKLAFEREANQGGSELLFQRDVFSTIAAEYEIGLGAIVDLHDKFGASLRATIRRFAETHHNAVAAVVLEIQPVSTDPLAFRRHEAVGSPSWREKIGGPWSWPSDVTAAAHGFVPVAAAAAGLGRASGECRLRSRAGSQVAIKVEVLNNTYHLLVLLWEPVKRVRVVHRRRVLSDVGG